MTGRAPNEKLAPCLNGLWTECGRLRTHRRDAAARKRPDKSGNDAGICDTPTHDWMTTILSFGR